MTDETKAKISATLMGHVLSDATKAKIGKANSKNHPVFSVETRAKLSAAGMGHVESSETRAKISAALTGKVVSAETRAKFSIIQKGHICSPETRAKTSKALWKGGRQVYSRKEAAKRRVLGFVPMNQPFIGCEGHHLNQSDVIYIPKALHRSIAHNVWTGRNMEQINALASNWMTGDRA